MDLPIIPSIAACLLLVLAFYKFIIYPAFLSPLAKIPNAHWSAPVSPAWILYQRRQHKETFIIHDAHTLLGPVIRIAPNELSVNSVDGGIRTIYAGGYEKGDWYSNVFVNFGVEPMFAMEHHTTHSKRKRMLSNVYAKSTLQKSPPLTKQTEILLENRLYPRLKAAADSGEPIELYDVFSAVTMDFVCCYIFGMKAGSNYIQDVPAGIKIFREFKARQEYQVWSHELPRFTTFLGKIGLKWLIVPNWVGSTSDEVEAWHMKMCDAAEEIQRGIDNGEAGAKEDYPTVYSRLRNELLKEPSHTKSTTLSEDMRLHLASELLDHTLAGFDTSGIILTWLAWQLSLPKNTHWQQKLHTEIQSLKGSHDAKEIDSLPILNAILMETLRLHAAIPGNQPRITPPNASLGPFTNLPANVRVQSQAYSLHRNPEVFPSPETWDPERWLNPTPEMTRWFWAFGSGGRMCVGSNLAMLDMKATIAALWGRFKTEIVDDEGMMPNGGYMSEPLGVGPEGVERRFLRCRLTEL